MAKIVPLLQANTFMIRCDEKDMEMLTELTQRRRTNYPDTVLACFHNGLVLMDSHKHCQETKNPL